MEMIVWMFRIRNKLMLTSLSFQVAWLRLRRRRLEVLRSEFLIYTLVILLAGVGLGMAWRANQVEPGLRAKIAAVEREKSVAFLYEPLTPRGPSGIQGF